MKHILVRYLFLVLVITTGCSTTDYMSHIKDVPFEIDDVYRQLPPKPRVAHEDGSIWQAESATGFLYTDLRATRIGDIITIKIIEATSASEKAITDLKRTGNTKHGIPSAFGLETYPMRLSPSSVVESNTKSDHKGDAKTERSGSMMATISARVVEVMPNGNLAIEGKREITLNGEKKEILLQGMVRPRDIASDNSVYSTQVADARIIMTGVGVVSEKQNPGWFARLLDLVWPF
jgi:flagellar L-ring protein precursor FlgH